MHSELGDKDVQLLSIYDTAHGCPNVNVRIQTWTKCTHVLIARKSSCDCLVWPLKITVLTTPAVLPGKYTVSLKPEIASAELPQCGLLAVTARGSVLYEGTVKRKHAQ